jgi:acyl-CoA synthetase (NDP forming)
MADAVTANLAGSSKPVLAYVSPHAPQLVARLNGRGIPAFAAPESCGAALAALWRQSRIAPETLTTTTPAPVPASVAAVLEAAHDGALDEAQAKQVFAAYGIAGIRELAVQTPAQAGEAARRIGRRVVLKALSSRIAHKSEVGGVRVNLASDEVPLVGEQMLAAVTKASGITPDGLLVQEMQSGGVELILGFHRDPQLGPSLLLGMGGVTAELLKDTAVRLLPVTRDDARAMVRELKTFPLLDGYRGKPPCDIEAVVEAILSFAAMAQSLGERLREAEINPLFVLPRGQGVRAADGLLLLAQ